MNAHQCLTRRAQVRAERRVPLLAGAKLVLRRVGDRAEILDTAQPVRQASEPLPVEGRALGEVSQLPLEPFDRGNVSPLFATAGHLPYIP